MRKNLRRLVPVLSAAVMVGALYLAASCVSGGGGGGGDSTSPCVDHDRDKHGISCQAGLDCDDSDPDNWSSCATCADLDGDGFFAACDAYTVLIGPDACDNDPDN